MSRSFRMVAIKQGEPREVPVNRPVTQYNHKSENLVLSARWSARGFTIL